MRSTLPFPTADTEPGKQHGSQPLLLLNVFELSWEQVRAYLACGIVLTMILHFLFTEIYAYMTQLGCFTTVCFHICQTGVFGAAGFIAAGAFQNSGDYDDDTNKRAVDGKPSTEATLVMADLAFQASAVAMAITDARGRIEKCNPAFVRITSPSLEYQPGVSESTLETDSSNLSTMPALYTNVLLETALGLVDGSDAERLQRIVDSCQSMEYSGEEDYTTKPDNDFLVHGRTLNVRVSLGSGVSSDAEQALLLLSVLGSLFENARLSSRRYASSAAPKRYVVVVDDVTFDRSLVRAIHESTALMHHGESEALMKIMMSRINSTRVDGLHRLQHPNVTL
jgi:PAS domain-containing protein